MANELARLLCSLLSMQHVCYLTIYAACVLPHQLVDCTFADTEAADGGNADGAAAPMES